MTGEAGPILSLVGLVAMHMSDLHISLKPSLQ